MSRILNGPSRGRRRTATGLSALTLGLLAAIALAPQANAAFTTTQCQGANALGRGASFAQAAQGAWKINFINGFCGGAAPNVTYEATGSGAGIAGMALRGGADPRFGGTDDPLTPAQINTINAGTAAAGDEGVIHQIPAAVGAVAPLVNFPSGCDPDDLPQAARTDDAGSAADDALIRVRFTKTQYEKVWAKDADADTWREVFPTLADSPACNAPIIRVVRFDHSGTTFAFKDYLDRINGARNWLTTFQTGTGGNRAWPNANFGDRDDCGDNDGIPEPDDPDGPGAPGLPGDTDQLTSACANNATNLVNKLNTTEGSIGYADIASARAGNLAINPAGGDNDIYWTQLQNGSGDFVEPTADPAGFRTDGQLGANCTQTQFTGLPNSTLGDWSQASGVNSPTGFGLCTLTYGMVFDDNADAYGVSAIEEQRARTVKDYWTSIVSDAGQAVLFPKDYTSLPVDILAIARAGVNAIDWNKGAGGGGGNGGGGNNGGGNNGGGNDTPPPPPAKPSNQFSVPRTAISSKTGSATLSVKLPGRGRLELVGNAKVGKKTIRVGRVVLTANRAGTFKLTLKPSKAAKNRLKSKGRLKVTLKLTYTPTGGSAKSSTRTVTLKLNKPKKPKKKSGRR